MSIELRNGVHTEDRRLDRIVRFDDRSLAYPIRTLIGNPAPRGYTWSVNAWLDQGQEGACVGFSFAQELLARPLKATGVDAAYARERIYWEAQKIDPWAGGAYPGASPFMEGTSVLDGARILKSAGHYAEFRWAGVGPTPVLEDLILAVGYKGPAVLGINWYEGMWDTDADGMIHPTGRIVGGHAILCNAVSVKRRVFHLHNSWGQSWGVNGGAFISFDELDRLLHEGGEACVPVKRAAVA